jgi:hypothetical protein
MALAMFDVIGRHEWCLLLNTVTEHKTYAISLATKTKNGFMVRALLARGARVVVSGGENALLLAAGKCVDFVVCRELLRDLNVEGKYSTENLQAIMFDGPYCNEAPNPKTNLWDLLFYWRGAREPDNWQYSRIGNPLLELAWKTACVRQLKTPAFHSRDNRSFQIMYERFVRGRH